MAHFKQNSFKTNTQNHMEGSLLQLRSWQEKMRAPDVRKPRMAAKEVTGQVSRKARGSSAGSWDARDCTKLSQEEIQRRRQTGRCTYCSATDHVRSSCAVGRLMRKVPKSELMLRVRQNVCPLCGDPEKDRHMKPDCPLKAEMEAEINARKWSSARERQPAAAKIKCSAQRVLDWIQRGDHAEPISIESPADKFEYELEPEWLQTSESSSFTSPLTPKTGGSAGGGGKDGKQLPPYPLEDDFLIDLKGNWSW